MESSVDPIEPGVNPDRRPTAGVRGIVIQGLSKLLMAIGGMAFLFGDRALRELWHVPFVLAMLAGIGGGIALLLAGAALQLLLPESKRMKPRKGRS